MLLRLYISAVFLFLATKCGVTYHENDHCTTSSSCPTFAELVNCTTVELTSNVPLSITNDSKCFIPSLAPPWLEITQIHRCPQIDLLRADLQLFYLEDARLFCPNETYFVGPRPPNTMFRNIMWPNYNFDGVFGYWSYGRTCVGGIGYLLRKKALRGNCEVVFGGLQIVSKSQTIRVDQLEKIKMIHQEGLVIYNSSFTNITMKSLELMYMMPNGTVCVPSIEIMLNAQLTYLDFPSLRPENLTSCSKLRRPIRIYGNLELSLVALPFYGRFRHLIWHASPLETEVKTKQIVAANFRAIKSKNKPWFVPFVIVLAVGGVLLLIAIAMGVALFVMSRKGKREVLNKGKRLPNAKRNGRNAKRKSCSNTPPNARTNTKSNESNSKESTEEKKSGGKDAKKGAYTWNPRASAFKKRK